MGIPSTTVLYDSATWSVENQIAKLPDTLGKNNMPLPYFLRLPKRPPSVLSQPDVTINNFLGVQFPLVDNNTSGQSLPANKNYQQNQLNHILKSLLHYSHQGDLRQTLLSCQKASLYVNQASEDHSTPLLIIYYHHLLCLTHYGQVEDGEKMVKKATQLLQKGSHHWLKFQELLIILYARAEAYQEAFILLEQVTNNELFNQLDQEHKESWMIYEAYLLFATTVTAAPYSSFSKPTLLECFFARLQKENPPSDLPPISETLVRIFLAIVKKDAAAIKEYKGGAHHCYCSSLQSDQRERHFFRWIRDLATVGFNLEKSSAITEQCVRDLLKTQRTTQESLYCPEIIPFEKLWVLVQNALLKCN